MKLAISNTVEFPVRTTLNDNGTERHFVFRLSGQRLTAEEWERETNAIFSAANAAQGQDAASTASERLHAFLHAHLQGWRQQTLVVDDDGQPAPFSAAALDVLLSVPDLNMIVLTAYRKAVFASHTEAGRQKN